MVSPWMEATSVHERYPGLEGQLLMQQIFGTYLLTRTGKLPFFMNSRKYLARHEINRDRDQVDTRNRYKNLIARVGILSECHVTWG